MSKKTIHHMDTLELVGDSEAVAQARWGPPVSGTLEGEDVSGQVVGVTLSMIKGGSGTFLSPTGKLVLFDTLPTLALNASKLGTGVHQTILGSIDLASGNWVTDTNGSFVFATAVVPFYALKQLHMAWYHESATGLNSAVGDDEILQVDLEYSLG